MATRKDVTSCLRCFLIKRDLHITFLTGRAECLGGVIASMSHIEVMAQLEVSGLMGPQFSSEKFSMEVCGLVHPASSHTTSK